MRKILNFFTENAVLANWIMLIILMAGVFGLYNMKMRIWPKMELNYINIDVPYPGASALEVEEGVITKIEENLKGMEGLEGVYSSSMDGYGNIFLIISSSQPMAKSIDKVRNIVSSVGNYPSGAETPVVYQETSWNRAMLITIYGPEDVSALKNVVQEFEDDLLRSGKISQINSWGLPSRHIYVEVLPESLRRYGLTINDISRAIGSANLNISSGAIVTDQERILIRTYSKQYEAGEIGNIPVYSAIDGTKVLLREICTVEEKWPDNVFYTEVNGQTAVGLNIMYNNNEDVIEIAEAVDAKIEEYNEKYEGLVTFEPFIRDVDEIETRLGTLTKNGLIGLVLVVLILGIFLNIRLSLWVALGIPISFAGLMFVIWTMGITINEMSLFGMIMVIGILVDDGIVIGESIFYQWEKGGKSAMRAAIDGTLDVIQPVFVSIITTMIAFAPYFFMYGEMGGYVWQIGTVVVICLGFSLIEAAIILPVHLAHSKSMSPDQKRHYLREKMNNGIVHFIHNIYGPFLRFCLKYKWAVMSFMVAVILTLAGAFMGNHVKAVFFPEVEMPYAVINLEIPSGTSASISDRIRDDVIDRSLAFAEEYAMPDKGYDNGIVNYVSWSNGSTISIFLTLIPNEVRNFTVKDFSDQLSQNLGFFPEVESITVGGESAFGGNPISVRFLSLDYDQLIKAAELFKEELKGIDGVKDIQDDTPLGDREFVISLKPKGEALGLNLMDVTSQLRQGFYGQDVMTLQKGRDEVKIIVQFPREARKSISQIEDLPIMTPTGAYVPFKEIATYTIERGIKNIRHENGYRSIRVFANLDDSRNDLNVVLADINDDVIPRVLSQVEGVSKSFSGQSEEVSKMINSMVFSMAMAVIIMFTILLFQMKSFAEAGLVMTLIPLGFMGSIIGHYIVGIPVSFISFLGSIALAGIIVNDSVVFIDKYNKLYKEEGLPVEEAIYQAGIQRFRPIIMTTLTTAIGLGPLIFQKSIGGQFLIPMAVSVAFGLLFGTTITLLMLPSALYIIDDFKKMRERRRDKRTDKQYLPDFEAEKNPDPLPV
ncbi:efflux RND transporter permease subunit [Spirochaeta isovalerica]|uniref:Multidrug efflux pump subunit AcrB n=1 Tax=Spirochaeta isovalerica TaxID=150 RepID=A0A841RCG9_9SPIO|nr:efflux RND transporter permease subunit [Spirochaeta isovalerica]MBB6480927.1 multidrug efflux pump subunit AcrB [Spirochaeta isovalerica]